MIFFSFEWTKVITLRGTGLIMFAYEGRNKELIEQMPDLLNWI